MDNIKIVLIEKAYEALKQYQKSRQMYGETNSVTQIDFAKYCALSSVIRSSDLEPDFEEIQKSKELKIQIKYFEDIERLKKSKNGDWIDLRCAEDADLKKDEYRLLRLGIGMILPKGYEAHVLPRSSTPSKFGIIAANSMGIIDNSYSGDADEWKFPALAIRDTVIKKGDRIAQFRIVKNQPDFVFDEVEHLESISRGGIGSTGTR